MEEEITMTNYDILSPEFVTYEYLFKTIVIGNSDVGKSCLSIRATKNTFTSGTLTTIAYEYYEFNIRIKSELKSQERKFEGYNDYAMNEKFKNKNIKLTIWDTCGQEIYRSLVNSFYHQSSIAIIVYAINDVKSFECINDWVKQVKTYAGQNCKIALIGNKSDLNEDDREISYEQGLQIAKENNMDLFMETSAKNGSNTKELFINIAYLLYYDFIKCNSDNTQTIDENLIPDLLSQKKIKKGGCC